MGVNLVALIWGLAEATLFFIVPDVWLSALSLSSLKKALVASVYCLAGALFGGLVIYHWGFHSPAASLDAIARIPAINQEMLARVQRELISDGVQAILFGPLSGTPYKTYAVQAADSGIGWLPFLLISIPARLLRFQAITLLCWGVSVTFLKPFSPRKKYWVLILGWLLFYGVYFSKMLA